MPADPLAELLARVLGPDASVGSGYDLLTADVGAGRWFPAAAAVRDHPALDCRFFDWLTAYDDRAAGLAVVVHVYSLRHRHRLALRTRVSRRSGSLASLCRLWPGADWHERETAEMFGITFTGHPNPRPLLLPPGFEGHPLRKEFLLGARVGKPWPGAVDPADAGRRPARPLRPPGVPEPGCGGR